MSTRFCDAEGVNAQDFEALDRTIHRRALDAADRVIQAAEAQRS